MLRSIFNEKHLNNEIKLGLKQYVILGSGYDMSGYKVNNILSVFELDKDDVVKDKLNRVCRANINNKNIKYIECDFNEDWIIKIIDSCFDSSTKSYFSMLGLSSYLEKEVFKNTIITISSVMSEGSTILFDYPNNKILASKGVSYCLLVKK